MEKEYLLREKPLKALLLFAFPMIIGNLFQQFYNMADSVVVGRFVSENALAAVGASYSLTNVFISIAIGGGVGASVLTSRYFGARNYGRMKTSVSTALISFLVVSLVLGGAGLMLGDEIMELLNTPADIMEDSVTYLNIYFLGLPFLFMYNVLAAMFNALGRSKIPLYLLIFSSVFNVALDVVMVCCFYLGVAGVAWATLIAQGISAVMAFLLFLREMKEYGSGNSAENENGDTGGNGDWSKKASRSGSVRFDRREFISMCRIALPSILQQSTVSIGMMLVQSVVNSFGAQMLAGYSAGMRIESICIVPMAAMGNVMSSYTAQNLGAGNQERVVKGYRTAYGIVFGFGILLCVILELFYGSLIRVFLGDEGTALALDTGMSYMRFIGFFFSFIGLKMITDGLLRGAGDMKMFTIANLVNLGIRVVVAVTMAPAFGIAFVWYAVPMGWLANYLISFARYRKGIWRNRSRQ